MLTERAYFRIDLLQICKNLWILLALNDRNLIFEIRKMVNIPPLSDLRKPFT